MSTTGRQPPPSDIRVVSLNCWGLKFISKHRHARLTAIGTQLASTNPPPDLVALQECWTQQDYWATHEKTKHFLPHAKYYHSGIFGGGLAILSRWPIVSSSMRGYPLNGRPTAFFRGDWFVGKGVACATIRVGPGENDLVEVFNTHLHAPYEREPNDSYICHRTAQAWEIAKLMRGAKERGRLVLGLGDFNMVPLSLAHRIVETHGRVADAWRVLHPDSSLGAAVDDAEQKRGREMPSVEFNIAKNGTTCDSATNTWRWSKAMQKDLDKGRHVDVDPASQDPRAKRLDYVFFGNGIRSNESAPWQLTTVNVGMTERHPTLKCSLSDHFSVEATLSRDTSGQADQTSFQPKFLSLATYDETLAMIEKYTAREQFQRRARLYHFGGSIIVSIGCLVAVWWSPRNFVSFILMLVSTLGLAAGVIDGLIGGLFVGAELRALKEFRWEISNARELASMELEKQP